MAMLCSLLVSTSSSLGQQGFFSTSSWEVLWLTLLGQVASEGDWLDGGRRCFRGAFAGISLDFLTGSCNSNRKTTLLTPILMAQ